MTGRPDRQTRTGTQPQRGPPAYQYGLPQPGPHPQPGPTPQANAGAKPTAKPGRQPHPPPRQPPHPPRQPPPCQPPPCQPPPQRASALPGVKAKRLATSARLAKNFMSFDIAAPLKHAVRAFARDSGQCTGLSANIAPGTCCRQLDLRSLHKMQQPECGHSR
jgi:hypothetical protein